MARLTFGLPRMHKEAGERRDFLPNFVRRLSRLGAAVVLEESYGAGMDVQPPAYRYPHVRFAPHDEVYAQDVVLVLRYPTDDELRLMRAGACLISMIHFPTRPGRVTHLRALGLEAVSIDSIKDDSGRRLIENLRAVGWNGLEIGFQTLHARVPLDDPKRAPIRVTLIGAGAVGGHAMHAAVRYGDTALWQRLAARGIPGVIVTVVDYDVTGQTEVMLDLLQRSDILVDATQRPDASQIIVPNEWIGEMSDHAVLVDLSVDPYDCSQSPPAVKAIEGIPQGTLDQYVFTPDDAAFDAIPDCVSTKNRRTAVSCYSWPGIHPRACMELYGRQLLPICRRLIEAGGADQIDAQGRFFQRAIARATLSKWPQGL